MTDHPQTGPWASWPQAHNYLVTQKTNVLWVVKKCGGLGDPGQEGCPAEEGGAVRRQIGLQCWGIGGGGGETDKTKA